MNEFDVLSDRLRELGQQAPVPATHPLQDVCRGRVALRRRHAQSAAGVTTALVAVGAVAASMGSVSWPNGGGSAEPETAGGASGSSAPTSASTQSAEAKHLCTITASGSRPVAGSPTPSTHEESAQPLTPEATAALAAYREAAASILDPSNAHLDGKDSERSDNVQSGSACDPESGEYLTSLGTSIGWTGGGALGVVQVEVISPQADQMPNIVLGRGGWSPYRGQLPAGVISARIVDYGVDGDGGQAVVVKRTDGLTVAVAASGRWGNNVAPGSPSATDLPAVDQLLTLAASPRLILPDPASR